MKFQISTLLEDKSVYLRPAYATPNHCCHTASPSVMQERPAHFFHGETAAVLYVVMVFVDSSPLPSRVRQRIPFPPSQSEEQYHGSYHNIPMKAEKDFNVFHINFVRDCSRGICSSVKLVAYSTPRPCNLYWPAHEPSAYLPLASA